MKNITYALLVSTTLAFSAGTSEKGPLQIGKFFPYVSQTATNQINEHYLPKAKATNNGTLPSGSIAAMWQAIGEQGVQPYFEAHRDQLEASALYIDDANNNELTEILYRRAHNCTGETTEKALLWELYSLASISVFGLIEKESIPEINLKPISVVGIMKANQSLTFAPEETASFGGAIASTISIMNLIYKDAPDAFKLIYKNFLPREPESTV
jgi:hypothetical protein